jgi:hypothetical protein
LAEGNPPEKRDFFIEPRTNEVYDFIRFARTLPSGINALDALRHAPSARGQSSARKLRRRYPAGRGRFAKHFGKDGNPSETLIRAKQERLDNWRTLQELAEII